MEVPVDLILLSTLLFSIWNCHLDGKSRFVYFVTLWCFNLLYNSASSCEYQSCNILKYIQDRSDKLEQLFRRQFNWTTPFHQLCYSILYNFLVFPMIQFSEHFHIFCEFFTVSWHNCTLLNTLTPKCTIYIPRLLQFFRTKYFFR